MQSLFLLLLNMHVYHYFLKYNTDLMFMDVVPRSETTIVSNSIKAKELKPSPSNFISSFWISASYVECSNTIIWLSCLGRKFILSMLRLRFIFIFLVLLVIILFPRIGFYLQPIKLVSNSIEFSYAILIVKGWQKKHCTSSFS